MSNKGFWLAAIALFLSACGDSTPPPYPAPDFQTLILPSVPAGVSATGRDGNNLISWAPVGGALSYNVYWSPTAGVNKTNGTKIAFANNPQAHTGLANNTPYYYVVTTVGFGGEGPDSVEVTATPVAAAVVADPLYGDQWHLKNTGLLGGTTGEDINVEPVWLAATPRKGAGIRIAVVDDGLEIAHEDLASNVAANSLSHNYLNGGSDPTGGDHGTAVAGIAAARDLNGLGGRGAAPRANLVGYNFLQNTTTFNEADAMTRGSPLVHISTNSWGPPDGVGTLSASTLTWRTAIASGLTTGRGGLGTIYVFAAGNGAAGGDNSNYDGYANNRGVIAVTAVNDQGVNSSYAEPGANIWVGAPGGEFCNTQAITTTDRTGGAAGFNLTGTVGDYGDINYTYGDRSYTRCMNGTSAATPAVAGVIALMLEANPLLGWRDVRLILAQTARRNNTLDAGWVTAPAPYNEFNHKYGFGVVNANAAVTAAVGWPIVGPEVTFETPLASPTLAIPDFPTAGVTHTITVAGSGITKIEFIEITFSAWDHPNSGDLEITLTSPLGVAVFSRLAETHVCSPCTAYNGWVFGSARHLGEAANGPWTLTVTDRTALNTGTFQSWKLKFYGTP